MTVWFPLEIEMLQFYRETIKLMIDNKDEKGNMNYLDSSVSVVQ